MGYTTQFIGELKFKNQLTVPQLKELKKILGEDYRDHPEWIVPDEFGGYYIQFELTDEMDGIRWDGSEKFYDATGCVNLILLNMQSKFPDFGLVGQLMAQGEDLGDRWALVADGAAAYKRPVAVVGTRVCCPMCNYKFILEEAN